jgi:hypothetical protein
MMGKNKTRDAALWTVGSIRRWGVEQGLFLKRDLSEQEKFSMRRSEVRSNTRENKGQGETRQRP